MNIRLCSCCRSPNHSIPNCNSVKVTNFMNTIDQNIVVITNNLFLDNNQGINYIKSCINNLLINKTKSTLLATCYRFNNIYENINNVKINSKLKLNEIKNILLDNYVSVIIDVFQYYNGFITFSFKNYITKKIIKKIQEFQFQPYQNNYLSLFQLLRNQYYYNKRIGKRQLYDILLFIKNDPVFSWYYYSFSEEMKLTFEIVEEILKEYIDNKYNKTQIKIDSTFILYENNQEIKECSICLENYENKKEIKLNCCHTFCGDCIVTTIKKNIENKKIPPCPLCRTDIKSVEIHDEVLFEKFKIKNIS